MYKKEEEKIVHVCDIKKKKIVFSTAEFTKKKYIFTRAPNHGSSVNCSAFSASWPYCTALYCTDLYCTILYSTVLYCNVLFCVILNYALP